MESTINHFKNIIPKRDLSSHKGTFGHCLNISGCEKYTGAAFLSSISALKVGCGLCTLAGIKQVCSASAAKKPDIIFLPLESTKESTIAPNNIKKIKAELNKFSSIAVGCGLSTNKETQFFVKDLIKVLISEDIPLIIDADGINAISELKITKLPEKTVLTPHPKEMSRLMNVSLENILKQPEFWVKKCSETYNSTTILKLHRTLIAENKGQLYENQTGNSALSHGGSGDVLTGMINGFLAQGMNEFDACCISVYLHGLAGELASLELSEYSTLASDLLNYIPKAIKKLIK